MTSPPIHPWDAPLVRYFRSGWAVFLPYLALYLLFLVVGWPVSVLLRLYWFVHGLHLVAAVLVGRRHWARHGTLAIGRAVLPWILLALLFLLPGLSLEYPSDPWEHLRRINEWDAQGLVRDHSHWFKAGYFLPYSLFGWMAASGFALPVANAYVAAMSLLLAWQYYRLGLTVGLTPVASFGFVLLETLFAGNNAFSFHRYYGLSTTIQAQIAAVALIRVAVENRGPGWTRLPTVAAAGALAVLTALNHVQGLAIAAAGVGAVGLHTLWMERRKLFLVGVAALAAGSIAVLVAWPRPPALRAVWEGGWLTRWGGFTLLPNESDAARRVGAVLGWFGLINLACGFGLLLRNRLAGWLTLFPVAILCLPVLVVPAVAFLTQGGIGNIVVVPRLLFAIPAGLAVVACATDLASTRWRPLLLPAGGCGIAAALLIPGGAPGYNRLWHCFARVPDDLAMRAAYENFQANRPIADAGGLVATTSPMSFVLETVRPVPTVYTPYYYRGYANGGHTIAQDFPFLERVLANPGRKEKSLVILASPFLAFTPRSQTATLSGHWGPQETALAYAGMDELAQIWDPTGSPDVPMPGSISYRRGHANEPSR